MTEVVSSREEKRPTGSLLSISPYTPEDVVTPVSILPTSPDVNKGPLLTTVVITETHPHRLRPDRQQRQCTECLKTNGSVKKCVTTLKSDLDLSRHRYHGTKVRSHMEGLEETCVFLVRFTLSSPRPSPRYYSVTR